MTTDEFEDLVYKYLDGQTTAEENDRLNDRLKSDPASADFFVRIAKNEAWVQARHAEEPRFAEKLPPVPVRRPAARFGALAVAAAVLIAFLAILYASLSSSVDAPPRPVVTQRPPSPDPRRVEEPSRPAPERPAEPEKPAPEAPRPKERKPEVVPARPEPPREEPAPKPAPIEEKKPEPVRPSTAVAIAAIQRAGAADEILVAGQEIGGPAMIVYPDGTKVELAPDTTARDVPDPGKRLFVAKGSAVADVVKQKVPMVFATPQGEARVLGTVLALSVGESTRLEVREGKVRFTKPDGKSIEVPANFYTVAAPGTELKLVSTRVLTPAFEAQPVFASAFDAAWGKASRWTGLGGGVLQASRSEPGSSARLIVVPVPPNATVEVSVRMKCPKAAPGFFMELAARPGEHSAQDFDANPAAWTMVKKFDSTKGPNGNGNVWTKYSRQVATGSATRLTIGFKLGADLGAAGDFTGAWDSLRISY